MLKFRKTKQPKTLARQRQSQQQSNKPAAFSYYSRRSEQLLSTGRQLARSETAEKTRQVSRYWRQRFGFGVLLATSFACLVYVSTLTSQAKIIINDSAADQSVLQDVAVYESAATDILRQSLLNQNKITISTTGLTKQMKARFPELADVQVSLPLLNHRVQILLTPSRPVLILATTSGSYALDAGGVALVTGARLANLSTLQLPLVTDESNLAIDLRQQALPSDDVLFIATVLSQLKARDINVASASLPAGTSQFDVRLEGQPYLIKFNLASDSSEQQIGTLIAVYDRLKQQGVTPGQYIDVRVNGRAYYR